MLKQFKEFALKGNVVDMAVGVVIGTAFGKIVTSLVNDIVMPPIGLVIGNIDFSDLKLVLATGADGKPVAVSYGLFINNVINFLIIAVCIFLAVRLMSSWNRPGPAPAATTRECPECASTIPLKARRCAFCASAV